MALNEFNLTSSAVAALLGPVNQTALWVGPAACPNGVQDHRCRPSRVQLSKQDLAFVSELDRVYVSDGSSMERSCGVYGEKAMLSMQPELVSGAHSAASTVMTVTIEGTFGDGAPAILNISQGKGMVWYTAFHPGLSYFRTALPDTEPPCKGSTDDSYNHIVPTAFDPVAAAVLYAPLRGLEGARPVSAEPHLVEVGIVTSAAPKGTVLPLINWAGATVEALTVSLHFELPYTVTTATTATGAPVAMSRAKDSGFLQFTLALEIAADAIILR
jgi:hypothetical protein